MNETETREKLISLLPDRQFQATKWPLDLSRADLRKADLTGADLYRVNLTEADLTGAKLAGANLGVTNLTDANLAGANLTGAYIARANLTRVNLNEAHMVGASLLRANLTEATLIGANLIGANLTEADLTGADLTGACMAGSSLYRANLTGVTLNWNDHFLLAELLAQKAETLDQCKLVGLIAIGWRFGMCWESFLVDLSDLEIEWGLSVLAKAASDDDQNVPDVVKEKKSKLKTN